MLSENGKSKIFLADIKQLITRKLTDIATLGQHVKH